jgi:Spy/CpxP family protein refolding chaperone
MFRRVGLITALAVLLVSSGWLLGDDPKTTTKGRLPTGWTKLGLSADQRTQLYKVESEYQQKIEPLQQQIEKLRQQQRSDMLKVLTDAQRTRLREILASKAGLEAAGDDKKPESKQK